MRHSDIMITGLGVHIEQHVRTPRLLRAGLCNGSALGRSGQRGVAVATAPAPELAARAAREAFHSHQALVGEWPAIALHLHAASWATTPAACYVLDRLRVPLCGTTLDLAATTNGVQVLHLALCALRGDPAGTSLLITHGDQIAGQGLRGSGGHGMLRGDAGAALIVSRTWNTIEAPGVPGRGPTTTTSIARSDTSVAAAVLATATYTNPSLHVLAQRRRPLSVDKGRVDRDCVDGDSADPADCDGGELAWLQSCGDRREMVRELARRSTVGVTTTTTIALQDAEVRLDDIRWVLCPFAGQEFVARHWLQPLGFTPRQTLTELGLDLGYLGAADHIVALRHLIANDSTQPGDHLLLLSSGAGMTWSAAVLQIVEVPHGQA